MSQDKIILNFLESIDTENVTSNNNNTNINTTNIIDSITSELNLTGGMNYKQLLIMKLLLKL